MERNWKNKEEKEDEIISERSLYAVLEIIKFLKQNVQAEGIFRFEGRPHTCRKILASLRRGDRIGLRQQLDGAAIESAAALQMFLRHLRQPLIPLRVQKLVLAENPGVPERTVASDALGLLRQDLSGRHLELLTSLLDLLYVATKNAPTSELRGSSLPVALLPIFFDLKPTNLARWRQVAATFNELIITAPSWLDSSSNLTDQRKKLRPVLQEQQLQQARIHTAVVQDTRSNLMENQNLDIERDDGSIVHGDDHLLASVTRIPFVFHIRSRLHPFLRAVS